MLIEEELLKAAEILTVQQSGWVFGLGFIGSTSHSTAGISRTVNASDGHGSSAIVDTDMVRIFHLSHFGFAELLTWISSDG